MRIEVFAGSLIVGVVGCYCLNTFQPVVPVHAMIFATFDQVGRSELVFAANFD